MKITKILDKAETLDHNQRWKYMIVLGKDSKKDQDLSKSLVELASSEVHYERILALMSTQGSFDTEIISRLFEDPSVIGMLSAIKLAAQYLDTELLVDIIPELPKNKRMRTAMALMKIRRFDIIERLYSKCGMLEQQEMLFYTSDTFFKKHLELDKIDSLTEKQWRQLAKRFPDIAYEQTEKNLKKSTNPSWLTQRAVYAILNQTYKTASDIGMSLLSQAIVCMDPRYLPLAKYAQLYPEKIAELILKHPTHISVSLPISVLRKLNKKVLCKLVKKNAVSNLSIVFYALQPEQREALYHSNGESFRNQNGALPLNYVKALPKLIREKEAIHAFNLVLLETRPFEKLPYIFSSSFFQSVAPSDSVSYPTRGRTSCDGCFGFDSMWEILFN